MIAAISIMWIVRCGSSYVFIKLLGTGFAGAWYAMMIDWVFRCFFFSFATAAENGEQNASSDDPRLQASAFNRFYRF
jgi:Na+-driven multidrug efflux pump